MTENQNPLEPKVRVVIERNSAEEALQAENDQLKEKMTEIATIEFAKQCAEYGLNPSEASAYDLETAKEERKNNKSAPRGQSETAPLNYQQLTGETIHLDRNSDLPLDMCEFEDEQSMIQVLNERSKTDPIAKLTLNKMNAKLVKGNKPIHIVYNGKSLLSLVKSEVPILPNDSEETVRAKTRRNEATKRDRTSWSSIEF